QAEDGIRDFHVTGVQTCALPISASGLSLPRTESIHPAREEAESKIVSRGHAGGVSPSAPPRDGIFTGVAHGRQGGATKDENYSRSEERRVGKECRIQSWWKAL